MCDNPKLSVSIQRNRSSIKIRYLDVPCLCDRRDLTSLRTTYQLWVSIKRPNFPPSNVGLSDT